VRGWFHKAYGVEVASLGLHVYIRVDPVHMYSGGRYDSDCDGDTMKSLEMQNAEKIDELERDKKLLLAQIDELSTIIQELKQRVEYLEGIVRWDGIA
jgi:hypothetical protein